MTTNDERSGSQSAPILRRRWKSWILLPTVLGAVIGAALATRVTPVYKSETLILVVPQRVPESYVRSTVATSLSHRQSITGQILSRTRLTRIIQDFDLYKDERRTGLIQEIVEGMRKNVEVDVVGGDALRVGFTGTEPRAVQRVTERLAILFIEENMRERELLADSTIDFLRAQLGGVRGRFVEANQQLRAAREKGLPEAEPLAIEHEVLQTTFKDLLAKIEESRMAANLERRQIGEQLKLLDPARVPERPIAPDWRKYVGIGTGAGAAVGALLLLLAPTRPFRKGRVRPHAEEPAADEPPTSDGSPIEAPASSNWRTSSRKPATEDWKASAT